MTDRLRPRGDEPPEDWITSEARDLADATRRRLEEAKNDAQGYAADCRRGVLRMTHGVADYTRQQPMTALLLAAGTGLVLGWLSPGRR